MTHPTEQNRPIELEGPGGRSYRFEPQRPDQPSAITHQPPLDEPPRDEPQREPKEPPDAKRWTIAVDFDGVLHHWDGIWGGAARIEGLPIDGAIDWLNRTAPIFDIAVYSTRCEDPEACEEITAWLWNHGVSKEAMGHIRCTAHKPPALIYLDDRAMRFTGTNWPTEEDIHAARPWWR